MTLISLRILSSKAIKPAAPRLAALSQSARWYTVASNPTQFASIDEKTPLPQSFNQPLSVASQHAHGRLRYDWTKEEIEAIYHSPIMELLYHGANVHRLHFNPREVQQCTLLSIKTGGCSEDCKYCPQSSKHSTSVKAQKMLDTDEVLNAARAAKAAGSTRFCMGAAWRDLAGRKSNFKKIVGFVKEIRAMEMEVCCTLGMLNNDQAKMLKEAGLTAYNHNLDTSREYYPKIITTRTYDERLETISKVREAGISVCSGGIIGLGETDVDRVGMLHTLSTLPSHPESVPVNALLAVEGTPLEKQEPVKVWDMVRMIATARIVMPKTMIRLSAGRVRFSEPEQALCFMAGANSIFTGDKLLTTPNNEYNRDQQMFDTLGLVPKPSNLRQGSDNPDYVANAAASAAASEKKECCGSHSCSSHAHA
ncbi:biotin synthase [Actinomortierella ambigua]|uniref:biotin synthase n=1 Tax=Actinomortierella ambigua TaxID=1343610 RepID=A0A9P6UD22_9FUNG|nr:biotin synthase [Actinomortierella ambigua]